MFDWFRKKKKIENEAELQPTPPSPEAGPETDQPETEAEARPAETEAGGDETPPTQANEIEPPAESAPAGEEPPTETGEPQEEAPAESKGFFARFREKLASGESLIGQEDEAFKSKYSPPPAEEASPATAETAEALEAESEPEAFAVSEPESPAPAEAEEILAPTDEPAPEITDQSQAQEPPLPEAGPEPQPPQALPQEISAETEPAGLADEEALAAEADSPAEPPAAVAAQADDDDEGDEETESKGLFSRFKDRLAATRNNIAGRLETLLSSVRTIDDDLLDELEELLITADIGVKTTGDLLFKIRGQVAAKELKDVEALKAALKKRMLEMVDLPNPPMPQVQPIVIMVVGINGVGKTTTIAKLARRFVEDDQLKVLLAAGDTFRSAAVDQLSIWADRLGVDIVSQPTGADASAVVFDALTAAQARKSDVVIIDTAGRLHTKVNLMDELKKIKRVANKALPGAPHHTILVLDGNTGQNAQRQAQTFHEAVGVDSIIVTKLDGTAKGGVIVSITNELKIPIAFVGLGESFEDLQPFNAQAFTEAILTP